MKSKNLGLLAVGLVLAAATTTAMAEAPQAVVIEVEVVFGQPTTGTFNTITGPICETGTMTTVADAVGGGGPTLLVNALEEFTCDDGSGTFFIRVHPQFNGRKTDFNLAGPWSIWGKGTYAYAQMSGAGDFGVLTRDVGNGRGGTATYVGFVNL